MKKAVLILFLLFAAQIVFAQEDAANKKVEEALKTGKVSLWFRDAALTVAITTVGKTLELNFVFDPKLENVADIPVTIEVEDMPLNRLLTLLLEPHGLAFCVKDGAVFISTKERIAEILGKVSKPEGEVKPGEVLFLLTDGSRVKGTISITELQLKTAYGALTIPIKDILEMRFPVAGKEEGKESQPTEDEVKTVKFTVTGSLLIDKFEVKTTGGTLTISKTDIEQILLQPESPAKLEPGKEEWQTVAAGFCRTAATTAETYRIKAGIYPATDTAVAGTSVLFDNTTNPACNVLNPSAATSYTFTFTRDETKPTAEWTLTADTNRTNLNDFFIDETGVLRAAPSTGDGSQAGPESAPYGG